MDCRLPPPGPALRGLCPALDRLRPDYPVCSGPARWFVCGPGALLGAAAVDLDDRLVEEGLRIFKCKTKKELIHLALQELLKTEKRKEILKLRGRLQWEGDLEEMRRSRV